MSASKTDIVLQGLLLIYFSGDVTHFANASSITVPNAVYRSFTEHMLLGKHSTRTKAALHSAVKLHLISLNKCVCACVFFYGCDNCFECIDFFRFSEMCRVDWEKKERFIRSPSSSCFFPPTSSLERQRKCQSCHLPLNESQIYMPGWWSFMPTCQALDFKVLTICFCSRFNAFLAGLKKKKKGRRFRKWFQRCTCSLVPLTNPRLKLLLYGRSRVFMRLLAFNRKRSIS